MTIFDKIQELETVSIYSKHDQLVFGITNAIDDGLLEKGSNLPSVNVMVSELGFARKTIVKAYGELKDKGIIESKKRLGYFVSSEDTNQELKIAVLLYAFHPFQELFYNTFRSSLGPGYHLDVFFHHNNMAMFQTILDNIRQQYGMYVIAPIPHEDTPKLLKSIPENKLLVVDRYEDLGENYSFVSQEFKQTTYNALQDLLSSIQNYNKVILFFKPKSDYPIGVLDGFEQFITDFNLVGEVQDSYQKDSVEKGTVYFTIGDGDLWNLLKDCKEKQLAIGKDVGVASFNEQPAKELVLGGITTISTDFGIMAQKAAIFVQKRKIIQEFIPTVLIRRNSL